MSKPELLKRNTRPIPEDVPCYIAPEGGADEYHWRNPWLIRDGNKFAEPIAVELYAELAALRAQLVEAEAKLAGAMAVVDAAREVSEARGLAVAIMVKRLNALDKRLAALEAKREKQ